MALQGQAAAAGGLTPGRYLRRAGAALLLLWALMAAWTVTVDPFGLFRLVEEPGFNQDKSDAGRLQSLLRLLKRDRGVVVLGSSRVAAFDRPLRERFPGEHSMAFHVPDLRAPELAELLEFIGNQAPPRRLFLALDFFAFNRASGVVAPQYARLDGLFWPDFVLRNLLSWDAFREAIRVVARSGDAAETTKQVAIQADRQAEVTGKEPPGKAVARFRDVVTRYFERHFYGGFRFDTAGAERVEQAIRRLTDAGTEVVLFIGPPHAALLATLRASGAWPAFELFQRHVAGFADSAGLPVWDFVAIDDHSGEAVGAGMQWYQDPSHYRPALAALLLARMAGDTGAPPLGLRLTPAGVDDLLAAQRAALTGYLEAHPDLVRLVEGGAADAGVPLSQPLLP